MADSDGIVISSLENVSNINTGDLLLISQVQSDGTYISKKIDANVINDNYILFEGSTMLINDTSITLSDSISNYKRVDIFYMWANWLRNMSSAIVSTPTDILLSVTYGTDTNNLTLASSVVELNNTTLTHLKARIRNVIITGDSKAITTVQTSNLTTDGSSNFKILKIIGHKK